MAMITTEDIGSPLTFLPIKVSQENYDLLHHEYRAHSFHNAFHNHMFVEFGNHEELRILHDCLPDAARQAEENNCSGVKIYCV